MSELESPKEPAAEAAPASQKTLSGFDSTEYPSMMPDTRTVSVPGVVPLYEKVALVPSTVTGIDCGFLPVTWAVSEVPDASETFPTERERPTLPPVKVDGSEE